MNKVDIKGGWEWGDCALVIRDEHEMLMLALYGTTPAADHGVRGFQKMGSVSDPGSDPRIADEFTTRARTSCSPVKGTGGWCVRACVRVCVHVCVFERQRERGEWKKSTRRSFAWENKFDGIENSEKVSFHINSDSYL